MTKMFSRRVASSTEVLRFMFHARRTFLSPITFQDRFHINGMEKSNQFNLSNYVNILAIIRPILETCDEFQEFGKFGQHLQSLSNILLNV